MHSNFYITVYLVLLISLGYIATDIYLPSLPALAQYFDATDTQTQMTIFSYLLSFSLTPLIFGPLSDRIGRKKTVLGAMAITILATVVCIFVTSIQHLNLLRFLQGVGTGGVMIASRAIVADLFTGKAFARQMSIMMMSMPFILAVAPTVGGILQESFGWQAIFIFLVCYMALILTWVLIKPESLKQSSHKTLFQIFFTYRSHLNNRLFLAFGINFILPSLGMFAYLTTSPFLFQEVIGLSPFEYGSLALYFGGAILAAGYVNLKLLHHFSVTQILYLGICLVLLSGGVLLSFHLMGILTTGTLLYPALIYFTSFPLCVSNAASKSMGFVQDHFGVATALLTTFQFLVGALGSFIFSFLPDKTALSLAICFIVVGLLSLINLIYACRLEAQMRRDLQS